MKISSTDRHQNSQTETQMFKIGIVIPYFGTWPDWIDLFLYSCEQNRSVDFIIYTDCVIPKLQYENIEFISISFRAYCEHVSERLKIDFRPSSPYKLCDLKPFYGFIHQDILKHYEFWGFGDVDVIWGNISNFYTKELLEKYDVFSTHNDRLSGHLAILRNSEKYTDLCFHISDWKKKLISNENYALDEADFSRILFPESKIIGKFYRQIMMRFLDWRTAWTIYYSIFPFIHWILRFRKRKLYFKEQHTTPILAPDGKLYKYESDTWYYKAGNVSNDRVRKEYIYLHFMIYKKNSFRDDYFWKENFYKIESEYDYSKGVVISTSGIEKSITNH